MVSPLTSIKNNSGKYSEKINKPIKYIGNKSATAELYLHMVRMISEKKKQNYSANFLDKASQQYIIKIEKLLPEVKMILQQTCENN